MYSKDYRHSFAHPDFFNIHIMDNYVRTRKAFICHKKRDGKITIRVHGHGFIFVLLSPFSWCYSVNQRTRRDFPVHACHSIRNNDGGQLGLEIASWSGAPIWKHTWNEESGIERAEMGKVGLRTREPSIMHVPRSRCDWQINSMENGGTKKKALEKPDCRSKRRECHSRVTAVILRFLCFHCAKYQIHLLQLYIAGQIVKKFSFSWKILMRYFIHIYFFFNVCHLYEIVNIKIY